MNANSSVSAGPPLLTKRQRWLVLVPFLACLLLPAFKRTAILDKGSNTALLVSGALFFGLGAMLSFFAERRLTRPIGCRQTLGLAGIPILSTVLGLTIALWLFELSAFVGTTVTRGTLDATVTDKRTGRYGLYFARLVAGEGGRQVEAKISEALYWRLEPYRVAGRDCIRISFETGRNGAKRAVLPSIAMDEPIGVESYRPCGTKQVEPMTGN